MLRFGEVPSAGGVLAAATGLCRVGHRETSKIFLPSAVLDEIHGGRKSMLLRQPNFHSVCLQVAITANFFARRFAYASGASRSFGVRKVVGVSVLSCAERRLVFTSCESRADGVGEYVGTRTRTSRCHRTVIIDVIAPCEAARPDGHPRRPSVSMPPPLRASDGERPRDST